MVETLAVLHSEYHATPIWCPRRPHDIGMRPGSSCSEQHDNTRQRTGSNEEQESCHDVNEPGNVADLLSPAKRNSDATENALQLIWAETCRGWKSMRAKPHKPGSNTSNAHCSLTAWTGQSLNILNFCPLQTGQVYVMKRHTNEAESLL